MAFVVDDYANITLVQGDSGQLTVNGLNTDKNYTLYLAIQDSKRNPIGSEIVVNSNGAESVIFVLSPELTNLLTVKRRDESAEYYYGIKVCDESTDFEDTLLIGDSDIGDLNTITVYPKKVEGSLND
jgi:hypothetical protein